MVKKERKDRLQNDEKIFDDDDDDEKEEEKVIYCLMLGLVFGYCQMPICK